MLRERRYYYCILRPEAREREDAREREPRYDHCPERDRHPAPEPPHIEDVVAVHRVDDAAGPQEEERLEEGVVVEMEDARRERPDPQRQHHVPELRDCGV